jgi:hypothetical protein
MKFVPQYLLPKLASSIKIKKVKKLAKFFNNCQKVVKKVVNKLSKVVKKLSKKCQKAVKKLSYLVKTKEYINTRNKN